MKKFHELMSVSSEIENILASDFKEKLSGFVQIFLKNLI